MSIQKIQPKSRLGMYEQGCRRPPTLPQSEASDDHERCQLPKISYDSSPFAPLAPPALVSDPPRKPTEFAFLTPCCASYCHFLRQFGSNTIAAQNLARSLVALNQHLLRIRAVLISDRIRDSQIQKGDTHGHLHSYRTGYTFTVLLTVRIPALHLEYIVTTSDENRGRWRKFILASLVRCHTPNARIGTP